jgi:heterodisulfide reductase subunit A2
MEARIGVFLCNCGASMGNIDFDTAADAVARMSGIACVNTAPDLCLASGRDRMVSWIKENSLDRVVVAACSPEFKEHVFQRALEAAGLNHQLLSMANIREQCAWAHEGDVTAKAVELTKMAISRARLLQSLDVEEFPVERGVLVIGGGFSAMSAGLRLALAGLPTTLLVEAAALADDSQEFEGLCGLDMASLVAAVEADESIEVLTSARVVTIEGTVGDFAATIFSQGRVVSRRYGAILLATRCRTELALDSALGFGMSSEGISRMNIVSQEQLVERLNNPSLGMKPAAVACMFGFADESSRFAVLATLNNALAAKRAWGSEVYVLCKDVKVDSDGAERLYREARDCGVVFVKCPTAPRIASDNGRMVVEARDVLLGEDIVIVCDLVVAEELLLPAGLTATLGSLLNVRLDSRGFYQDENVHLYPVGSERKAVFFVGECRGQSDIGRVLSDISSAVISIQELLSSGKMVVEIRTVEADPDKCVACLTCIRVCPHDAIRLAAMNGGKERARISDLACDACGICAAICPAKAIEFQGYSDDQILAQIEAIGAG